jgi:hypothetical protein
MMSANRGATTQQRNFALELESNVKKVTESYRNLLNGAKVRQTVVTCTSAAVTSPEGSCRRWFHGRWRIERESSWLLWFSSHAQVVLSIPAVSCTIGDHLGSCELVLCFASKV